MIIYKILPQKEWQELRKHGIINGTELDILDGYIHFSTGDTLVETLTKHFARDLKLKLLAYNDSDFGSSLKYEPSRNGTNFPHLYAPLKLTTLLWAIDLPYENERYIFPKNL